jgi:Bacterial hydrolase
MMLECGCPSEYPDWHGQYIDLSQNSVHVLPIAAFLHMPLSFETYRQRQQNDIERFDMQERWPGFALTRTGWFSGKMIRLLEDQSSASRRFQRLPSDFQLQAFLHEGGIGTMRTSVRQQQEILLDSGRMPKEMYLSYLTCPKCSEQRGGERLLLLRRWRTSQRLSSKTR